MRIHLRFVQFLSILLVLLSGAVIANDDEEAPPFANSLHAEFSFDI